MDDDKTAERVRRDGQPHFRMESANTACLRCAQAAETLLRRLGEA